MAHPVIKVITDSSCDLPPAWIERWDITVIPTVMHVEGQDLLDDGVQIDRVDFYNRLPMMRDLPTTSACPLGLTRDRVAAAAAKADHLVLLTAPAYLSSIYNTFRLAAEEFKPGAFTLIDSGQTSMGLGWLVLSAVEAAEAGMSPEAIRDHLEGMKRRTHIYAALSTLENLRKSGRVNRLVAMAGSLLQIKPLVHLYEGEVALTERVRTFRRAQERLIELGRSHAPLERLAVLHTNNSDGAQHVLDALSDVAPPGEIPVVNVNPPLGTHVGAQGVGIALVTGTETGN